MRIAIVNITGGGMSGGYRTYLRNVLPRFAVYPEIEAVLCATPASVGLEKWLPALPKVSFFPCVPFRFLCHNPDAALSQAVARFAPDVIFIPVERYLRFDGIPLVVMLQNMAPLAPVVRSPWSERLRYVAQRHEARLAIRRADRVIAPTNFVRSFLINKCRISEKKVATVHYGVSVYDSHQTFGLSSLSGRGGEGDELTPRKPSAIPESWAGRFIFTAGSIEPYRGLEDALEAMKYMRNESTLVGLVIAGEARSNMVGYQNSLQKWLERHRLQNKVCWTGVLKEAEMSWCYRRCFGYVATSRIESFGITGLEAIAHGCLILAADNPPLPEIFADAARYYAPHDGKELAAHIADLARLNSSERQAFCERALTRAALFSWDSTVEKTMAVLTGACQRR